jgi:hypothetical protein
MTKVEITNYMIKQLMYYQFLLGFKMFFPCHKTIMLSSLNSNMDLQHIERPTFKRFIRELETINLTTSTFPHFNFNVQLVIGWIIQINYRGCMQNFFFLGGGVLNWIHLSLKVIITIIWRVDTIKLKYYITLTFWLTT